MSHETRNDAVQAQSRVFTHAVDMQNRRSRMHDNDGVAKMTDPQTMPLSALYDPADERYTRDGITDQLARILLGMEKDGSRSMIFGRPFIAAILDQLKTETTEHKLIRDMALCINDIWPWADSEALQFESAKERREHEAAIKNARKLLIRFDKWQHQQ